MGSRSRDPGAVVHCRVLRGVLLGRRMGGDLMGCMIVVVGIFGGVAALDDSQAVGVRIAGMSVVALCLILGTVLQMVGKFDD